MPKESYVARCSCGRGLIRMHRSVLQRLLYSGAYRCKGCGRKSFRMQRWIFATYHSVFCGHSRCVNCGGNRVHRVSKRDRIDSLSRHPLSILLGLFFAPLVKCPSCRLQFHDFRKPLEPHSAHISKPVESH